MALDTISRVLNLECCWIQLFTLNSNNLSLDAYHGFTPYMLDGMTAIDLTHPLAKEVIGLGNTVIIPDLVSYGNFDISLFEEAGFRSLIAVPVITHRVNGIMGAAYRLKKRFSKDYSSLFTAIASMTGMAFYKCLLIKQAEDKEERKAIKAAPIIESPVEQDRIEKSEPFEPEADAIAEEELRVEVVDNEDHEENIDLVKQAEAKEGSKAIEAVPIVESPVEQDRIERPEPSEPEVDAITEEELKNETGDNDEEYEKHIHRMKVFRYVHDHKGN